MRNLMSARNHDRNETRLRRIARTVYYLTASDRQESVGYQEIAVCLRLAICEAEGNCGDEAKWFARRYSPLGDWQKMLGGFALVEAAYCHESGCDIDCIGCPLHSDCPSAADMPLPEFLEGYALGDSQDWGGE